MLTVEFFQGMAKVGDFPKLQKVFLKLTPDHLDDTIALVSDCFSNLKAVEVLHIQARECGVEKKHLERFFAAPKRIQELKVLRLDFSHNKLTGTSRTWNAVVAGITACRMLTELVLNLAGNDGGDSFLEALAGGSAGKKDSTAGIGCLHQLVVCEVNLGGSDLNGKYLEPLATAMSTCSKLKKITMILRKNEITGKHAGSFLSTFRHPASVENVLLDLRENSIKRGFDCIVEGIKAFKGQAFLRLDCGGNDISPEQAELARQDCGDLELTVDGDLAVQVSSSGSSDSGSSSAAPSDTIRVVRAALTSSWSSSVESLPPDSQAGTPTSYASGDPRNPGEHLLDLDWFSESSSQSGEN